MLSDVSTKNVSDFYWYYSMDLLNGKIAVGDYGINAVLHHYHFPDDMHGLRVPDVGRGSGAFAFEFGCRGADVVATDLSSFLDWDIEESPKSRGERPRLETRKLFRKGISMALSSLQNTNETRKSGPSS